MKLIAAYLARVAVNELATSALPDAPVVPDRPKRRPVHRFAALFRSESVLPHGPSDNEARCSGIPSVSES
jgi:hypothetical protein